MDFLLVIIKFVWFFLRIEVLIINFSSFFYIVNIGGNKYGL